MFMQWRNRNHLLLFGLCVAVTTTGCATGVVTSQHTGLKSEGVSYFLPRNHIRVVFTNANIASEVRAASKVLEVAKKDKVGGNHGAGAC